MNTSLFHYNIPSFALSSLLNLILVTEIAGSNTG